ncbi:head-tail connector protein [Pseudooceanicola aestuarii]|uniref:head-tail connector protein n=1 Tax=Pseudooceanicola aestuarii TaxID=2697319 RepID=UPI0013D81CF3|nr:hypothetical protein [Pseudooceanicola aestuarii]
MMLTETTRVPLAVLPLERLKSQLRLGTGFAAEDLQDDLLEGFLRAALAAVEARISKALILRDFTLQVTAWRDPAGQALPLAPVQEVTALRLVDATGAEQVVAAERYRLIHDRHMPVLAPRAAGLPAIPTQGRAEISLRAGLGAVWSDLPGDLGQAVMLLAAHYYEYRNETALGEGCMPFGTSALIEKYRPLRVGFGAGA